MDDYELSEWFINNPIILFLSFSSCGFGYSREEIENFVIQFLNNLRKSRKITRYKQIFKSKYQEIKGGIVLKHMILK